MMGALSSEAERPYIAPLGIERLARRVERHRAGRPDRGTARTAAASSTRVGVDRLAVVVDVERQRAARPRRVERREDDRRARCRAGSSTVKPRCSNIASSEVGVASHVGIVAGDIGDGHERDELVDDLPLVLRPPGGNRPLRRHPNRQEGGQAERRPTRPANLNKRVVAQVMPNSSLRCLRCLRCLPCLLCLLCLLWMSVDRG